MRMHRMTATGLMLLLPFAWALADRARATSGLQGGHRKREICIRDDGA